MKNLKSFFLFTLFCSLLFSNGYDVRAAGKTRGTVTFIFDDGRKNIIEQAFPVFKKHKFPASVAIFTNGIDKKDHMTKKDLIELNRNGWEVLSHGVSHSSLKTLSNQGIENELKKSKDTLTKLGLKVNGFVAPYSFFPESNVSQLKKHYSYAFNGYVDSRNELIQNLVANSKKQHNLIRANMEGKTLQELQQYIDYVHKHGQWLILYEHDVGTKNNVSIKDLDQLLSYTKGKVSVRNPSKVYGIK